jgi:hypothetical protein
MSWLKLDDGFADHPKVDPLTDAAFRLHVAAMCFCARNLTDGFIPLDRPGRMVPRYRRQSAVELEKAGLWLRVDGGWQVNDYLAYNPSKAEAKQQRQARQEAGRRGGRRSGQAKAQANASAVASANGQARGLNPVPSRPVGTGTESVFTVSADDGPAQGGPTPLEPELVAANVNGVRSLRQQLHGEAS